MYFSSLGNTAKRGLTVIVDDVNLSDVDADSTEVSF